MPRKVVLLGFAVMLALAAMPAPAAWAERALTPRYEISTRGDLAVAANTLLSCPASATCTLARAGTSSNTNHRNASWAMAYVDIDSDAATINSSEAQLAIPAGATVAFAGLYWSADTSGGIAGAGAPSPAFRGTAQLDTPAAGGYSAVTASVVDDSGVVSTRYQAYADVTAQVTAGGSGTYRVGNVQAGTGSDRWGGWYLAVVYRQPSVATVRRLAVYDGLQTLPGSAPAVNSYQLTLANFVASNQYTGTVRGRLGLASGESELGYQTETLTLNATNLTDAANPAGNQFNASIASTGTRNPNYVNQLGYDADLFNIDGRIADNATSATLDMASTTEIMLPHVAVLSLDQEPQLPANSALPGDLRHGAGRPDPQRQHGHLGRDRSDHLRLPVATLQRGRRLVREHRRRHQLDLLAGAGRHRLDDPARGHGDQQRGVGLRHLGPELGGHGDPAGQHRAAHDLRDRGGRADADGGERQLERLADDHLRLSVAPLRRGGRVVREHRRRHELDLFAGGRGRGLHSSRGRDRHERRRVGLGHLGADGDDRRARALEQLAALDLGHHGGRLHADRRERHVGRQHAALVRLPVAALQSPGRRRA